MVNQQREEKEARSVQKPPSRLLPTKATAFKRRPHLEEITEKTFVLPSAEQPLTVRFYNLMLFL